MSTSFVHSVIITEPSSSEPRQSSPNSNRSNGQPQNQKTKIITEILPNDILLGRGALAISNEGNVRFRNIIAGRKDEYISTSRRLKKDTIANEIRNLIATRNGRFLRRVTSEEKLDTTLQGEGAEKLTKGMDAWAVADEEVVLAKIKQSLRDKEADEREQVLLLGTSAATGNKKRALAGQSPLDVNEELVKRSRLHQGPTLDWNEPSTGASLADRSLGLAATHRPENHGSGEHQVNLSLQDRALNEELLELRERQRMLLNRSMLYGGMDSLASASALSSDLDPLLRYRQLDLLSSGRGGLPTSSNLDLNAPSLSTPASFEQQQRLELLRGTSVRGNVQDSSSSLLSTTQDNVIASLRQELELKERRAQIEAFLVQREEELLLRRLEQERDASLLRLRRQEAMLAALRQGRPLPDFDSGTSSTLPGGRLSGLLRDSGDLGDPSDLLTQHRQAELSALLGSRSMLNTATLDSVTQSLLASSRLGRLTDSRMLDNSSGGRNCKGSFDQGSKTGHGNKDNNE